MEEIILYLYITSITRVVVVVVIVLEATMQKVISSCTSIEKITNSLGFRFILLFCFYK